MRSTKYFVIAMLAGMTFGANVLYAQKTQPTAADKYLISAKAGAVNLTQGTVSVSRSGGTGGVLVKGDVLEAGQQVSTSVEGRAEILLNPGSYIRLGANSSFEFMNTSLDDLRVKLTSGTAIFEVFATNEFKVSMFTPKGRVTVVDSGVYRIDLGGDGLGVLSVIEGQAVVGEKNIAIVKAGYTATIGSGPVVLAKFDRDNRGDLAEWSRSRSKDLAKMASALKNKNVGTALTNSFYSGTWGRSRSFGVWVFNPISGGWCFVPYYSGWGSPYGYGYGTYIYWYPLPAALAPKDPTILDGRLDPPVDTETRGKGGSGLIRNGDSGSSMTKSSRDPIFSQPPMQTVETAKPSVIQKDKPIDN